MLSGIEQGFWAYFFKAFHPRCQHLGLKRSQVGHALQFFLVHTLGWIVCGKQWCLANFSGQISQVSRYQVFLIPAVRPPPANTVSTDKSKS